MAAQRWRKWRKNSRSLQSRRILGRHPWIVFRNDVVPPSWTLILPESWDESKSVFSLFRCVSRWWPRSMYLRVFVKKRLLCRLEFTRYSNIDIGQTFLKQWQQYRIDKYYSGFYLEFLVWGRSPECPKATSFLGGSGDMLPEIFWNEYALRCNLRGVFWDTILRNFTVRALTSSGPDDFSDIVTYFL